MLPWSKRIRNGSYRGKRREDCGEKGEVTDPSDTASSSTTMPYLARRIPLRHGTPQIRKAQIPRTPCGFAEQEGTMEKRRKDRRQRRLLRWVGGWKREERKGKRNFEAQTSRDWEYNLEKGKRPRKIAVRSMLWIFDTFATQSTCQNSNFER